MIRVTYKYKSCEKCEGKGEFEFDSQQHEGTEIFNCDFCEGTCQVAVKAITEVVVRVEENLTERGNWPHFNRADIQKDAVSFLKYAFLIQETKDGGYTASVVEPKEEVHHALLG